MANTFIKIASTTVGSGGAASIDFTSIPSTYTDLVVVVSARNTSTSGGAINMKFNGSSSNYSNRYVQGNGASASSATYSAAIVGEINLSNSTASTFASNSFYIPNYAGSTNKSVSVDSVTENNATTAYTTLTAGLWSDISAINQITFTPTANSFAQYSTATLYGIKNS
jgi:hypothetical protein